MHSHSVLQRVGNAVPLLVARHPLGVRVLDGDRGLPATHSHLVQGCGLFFIPLAVSKHGSALVWTFGYSRCKSSWVITILKPQVAILGRIARVNFWRDS